MQWVLAEDKQAMRTWRHIDKRQTYAHRTRKQRMQDVIEQDAQRTDHSDVVVEAFAAGM